MFFMLLPILCSIHRAALKSVPISNTGKPVTLNLAITNESEAVPHIRINTTLWPHCIQMMVYVQSKTTLYCCCYFTAGLRRPPSIPFTEGRITCRDPDDYNPAFTFPHVTILFIFLFYNNLPSQLLSAVILHHTIFLTVLVRTTVGTGYGLFKIL